MSIQEKVITAIVLLLCTVFFLNIGFASDFEDEKFWEMNNKSQTFNIEFRNEKIIDLFGVNKENIKILSDRKNLNINGLVLEYPGAYVDFSVDIINKGKTEAQIENLCVTGFDNSEAIKFTLLNYEDYGNKILKSGEKCTMNFRIEWDKNISIVSDEILDFNIQIPTSFVK